MVKTMDELLAQTAKENRAREAKMPAPKKEALEMNAAFLKKWSKGKPIKRVSSDSTFWQCGKFMTKIDFKLANALVKAGHATISGNPMEGGAVLTMKK